VDRLMSTNRQSSFDTRKDQNEDGKRSLDESEVEKAVAMPVVDMSPASVRKRANYFLQGDNDFFF